MTTVYIFVSVKFAVHFSTTPATRVVVAASRVRVLKVKSLCLHFSSHSLLALSTKVNEGYLRLIVID